LNWMGTVTVLILIICNQSKRETLNGSRNLTKLVSSLSSSVSATSGGKKAYKYVYKLIEQGT